MAPTLLKTYAVECAAGALAVVCLAGALLGGTGAAALASALACALAAGFACGSLLRRRLLGAPLAAARERIAELERRPTEESLAAVASDRDRALAELESARAELTAVSRELASAVRAQDGLAAEVARARQTASLDRFSDFQLLAMADVCDAEDAEGFLLRPYGDPAMEQLQALGAVAFDTSQAHGSAPAADLRWTLKAEWRQAVRAQRAAIDERTRALRDRRAAQPGASGPGTARANRPASA